MTQKEKAKAYDEALERMKSWVCGEHPECFDNAKKAAEFIFPVLKSEDERIREYLLKVFSTWEEENFGFDEWCVKDIIAWLEKQGNANKEYWRGYREGKQEILDKYAELEKQGEQPTLPKWKYKKDHNPLTRDSITLNKYGCVAKSPSGALVSDVWILDFDDLAKLPKEEIDKQNEQKLTPIFRIGDTIIAKDGDYIEKELFHINKIEDDCYWDGENTILVCNQDEFEIFKQKLVNRIKPRFKVGDWIIFNGSIYYVKEVVKGSYRIVSKDGITCSYAWNIDIAAGLWTIEDARDGDVLYSLDSNQPFIYKERKAYEQAKAYCGLNIYGKFFVWATTDCIITTDKYIPATKEQRVLLFQKMKEAGYEWDADKKELKKIEPKFKVGQTIKNKKTNEIVTISDYSQLYGYYHDINHFHEIKFSEQDNWELVEQNSTWSVEDERCIRDSIFYLKSAKKYFEKDDGILWNEKWFNLCIEWLESLYKKLQPQNTWKPSATDIKVLEDVIDLHVNPINYHATLHSILEQLKKLREE